jgi:hypothetical protein
MRRLCLILSAAAAIGIALAFLFGMRSRGGAQKYIAALRAKGERLSSAELIRGRPPGTGLAHSVITNNLALLKNSPIEPLYLVMGGYKQPGQVRVAWREPTPPRGSLDAEPRPMTWEEFDEGLRRAQPSLQAIREVLKTTSPEWDPGTNALDWPLEDCCLMRGVARWLAGAAMSELRQGRLEAALEDLEALAALANASCSGYSPAGALTRLMAGERGLEAIWQALQAQGWSDAQLERMQRDCASIDPLAAVEAGLEGERAYAIEFWEWARRSSGRQLRSAIQRAAARSPPTSRDWRTLAEDYVRLPYYKLTRMDREEVYYLRWMQISIDFVRAARQRQPWAVHSYATNFDALFLQRPGNPPPWLRPWSNLLTLGRPGEVLDGMRNETLRQMTLAAIAIHRYQLRYRLAPATLAALSPEFLPEPAWDPRSGKALAYRPGTNGDWLLYSVGDDGKDHGGDPTPTPRARLQPGLWEGLDAVWPKAAE